MVRITSFALCSIKLRILASMLLLSGFISTSHAQQRINADGKGIIYDAETAIDFRLHTYGFALNLDYGKIQTYYKTSFYQFGIGELFHFRETSRDADNTGTASLTGGYAYGKQNSLFVLRAGYGARRYFTEKADRNGVALGMSYTYGISLGVVKPYYLEIKKNGDRNPVDIRYTPETAVNFLNTDIIQGRSSFLKGIGESKFTPGLYGSVAVHLDWGAFDEFLKAVEAGIMIDIYPKKIPILIADDNRPFFLNFYVSVLLGKRK
jgi:hypothetical protein